MINLYMGISEEILKIVSNENVNEVELTEKLEERQNIIDGLTDDELSSFRLEYKNLELIKLDEEIKSKLKQHMITVKRELSEFKNNKSANTAYVNMNKNKLNIFYKKA